MDGEGEVFGVGNMWAVGSKNGLDSSIREAWHLSFALALVTGPGNAFIHSFMLEHFR